jgi:hypothetical protein
VFPGSDSVNLKSRDAVPLATQVQYINMIKKKNISATSPSKRHFIVKNSNRLGMVL